VHVLATAGHVDHGKSSLVRALTGMEPDRWAEERRRGMTLDLGFAWTSLPSGATVAFVDVPGHERFVPTMVAGVGPVPAVLLVVAADEGWRRQTGEHVAALDAFRVRPCVVALTRADLAAPERRAEVEADVRERLSSTTLDIRSVVATSTVTGEGLPELSAALDEMVATLPTPRADGPVRLWVDRAFTIRGAGTVVTGTLQAGSIAAGDVLAVEGREVRVRGLQRLGRRAERVSPVARVAVNLRDVEPADVPRGTPLTTPEAFRPTDVVDVRIAPREERLPATLTLHVGSAALPVQVRSLGADVLRLRVPRRLPLLVGDRLLLREPSRHDLLVGATVLDPAPPPLDRRGAAADRAADLARADGTPHPEDEVRRRGVVDVRLLEQIGVAVDQPVAGAVLSHGRLVADDRWRDLGDRLVAAVDDHASTDPLSGGLPVEAARARLDLPDAGLVLDLAAERGLSSTHGRLRAPAPEPASPLDALPPAVGRAAAELLERLRSEPFRAPEADELAELRLGNHEVAALARAGVLLRVGPVVLLPDALDTATERLREIEQPFTVSAARQALSTTRRVAVPLLEALDRAGRTRADQDGRRTVR
jgi:selenocysteine-specific elongation factor